MKIIFLDVDGVLNTSYTYQRKNEISGLTNLEIDKFRLEFLKTIIDKTKAKIVLSSSFRYFFSKEQGKIVPRTLKGKKLYDLFYQYGLEIFDTTPITNDDRETQIKEWLSMHDDVESFIILDDDKNLFFELYDRLILTSIVRKNSYISRMDDATGLCENHINLAIDMLDKKLINQNKNR